MVYYVSQYLLNWSQDAAWADLLSPLRVFQYITFRSAGAAVTALLLSLWLGPRVITWLKRLKFGQHYPDRAEAAGGLVMRVMDKRGTPTMGGIMLVLVVDLTTLIWARYNEMVVLTLLSLVVLGALGFYDDYVKVTQQSGRGTHSRVKLAVQGLLGLFIGVYLWRMPETRSLVTDIMVPFYKHPVLRDAFVVGLLLTVFTIVGSSNAVNLTDGLDGLAIGCTVIVAMVFVVMTYVADHAVVARYLQVPHVPGAGELTVFCSAMVGAGLGFLWFNCHPAQMFMGDTGSLAMGGVLGIIAVLIHQPLVLILAGGVFVAEAISVLLQTAWFKHTRRRTGTGQRLFRMAPLHHHFEKLGWYESQIVTRFYILGILCGILALVNLKLR
jgi:phospho-N-acetylmuramoyl-pentapeptide-transferase